ncbi:Ribosomal RNA small subunit methyltransferase G, partial [human gut metagenome]
VTIIDSLNKRILFLNHLADELGLENVHFYHGRAEDFAQDTLQAKSSATRLNACWRVRLWRLSNVKN